MKINTTRRGFLGAGAGFAAWSATNAVAAIDDESLGFKLGVASYSLRSFKRGPAIEIIKALKTPYVSVKEFHLPYASTPEELAQGRKEFEDAGLKIMSGGNITLARNDEADMRKYFAYARACGMPMMVCAPTHDNLKLLEALVKEYNIKAALHNHGPEDKQYPTPQSVLDVVKDLDPRVGLCMDVGHSTRAGADVIKSIVEAGPRLLDVHIKDLRTANNATQVDVGEGILPIVAIFKQLQKMGYKGCVNLEYEINADAPQIGMLKSFSYMRGVLAGLKG